MLGEAGRGATLEMCLAKLMFVSCKYYTLLHLHTFRCCIVKTLESGSPSLGYVFLSLSLETSTEC